MNHLDQTNIQIRRLLIIMIGIENVLVIGIIWAGVSFGHFDLSMMSFIGLAASAIMTVVTALTVSNRVMHPLKAIWQAVLHLSPADHGVAAPKLDNLKIGHELVANLIGQIYQFSEMAKLASADVEVKSHDLGQNFVASSLPLPLFILDESETIIYVNQVASTYIGIAASNLVGKNIYMVLDMSFPSEDTFDTWLKTAKISKATASSSWERVRLNIRDNHPTLLFDLAAYYNRDNSQSMATMLVLFDHTKQYSQDEQAVSFIALSVHELRTPLTMLRGYIEVLDDELQGNLNPELQGFMLKMRSSAEQLTAFVNNILNVARIDNDQLQLNLQEGAWSTILQSAIDMITLRAKVRGISLELSVDSNLPSVGVDSLSIREVVNNLIDNAIKYSGKSKIIKINSHLAADGLVETTVQDFGLGIPTSIMPNLFSKFYRDHRNRAQIGGTGLGLYLSKAIVAGHGGNIWVRSKEGEGSTFGFTLIPYSQLAEELKKNDNKDMVSGAHGWVKNHSLYRH
jgi:NtrC-family two-component system sensor histidine kinase KinB